MFEAPATRKNMLSDKGNDSRALIVHFDPDDVLSKSLNITKTVAS